MDITEFNYEAIAQLLTLIYMAIGLLTPILVIIILVKVIKIEKKINAKDSNKDIQ